MKKNIISLHIKQNMSNDLTVVAQEDSVVPQNSTNQQFTFRVYKVNQDKSETVVSEQIFDASCYNMATRNNVNIRDIANSFIKEFQYILRKKPTKTIFFGYDTVKHYKSVSTKEQHSFLDDNSNEFKMGLYINNINKESDKKEHIIIERSMVVDGHHPENRVSEKLYYLTQDFICEIKKRLSDRDKFYTYDTCAILYNFPTMDIDRINKMSAEDRSSILRKIGL